MRIILTEDEVADALENYISDQIVLNDNQKISVELTADGSAAVDIRSTGAKPKAKATARKTTRSTPKKVEKVKADPEPEDKDSPEDGEGLRTEAEQQAEEEAQGESTEEAKDEPESPAPEETKPVSSIFGGGGGQSKNQDNAEAPETTPVEEPVKRESSIFSKVG